MRSRFLGLSSGMLCSLLALNSPGAQATGGNPTGVWPDTSAPWPEAEKLGLWPKSTPATPPVVPAEAKPPITPSSPPPAAETMTTPTPALTQAKPRRHEIGGSVDYFFGQGDVSLPVFFSLQQTIANSPVPIPFSFTPTVLIPDRESSYYGGTISYSYQYAWYVDFSYQHGKSTGSAELDYLNGFAPLDSDFTIEDNWYQGYLRYTFPGLRGKRLSAYLRAGVSWVESDLTDETVFPNFGAYKQTNETEDLLGNIGFGLGYSLYTTRRFRLGLQFEGEGFYGLRTQNSTETLQNLPISTTVKIDNTLYGGLARLTVRFEYRLGQSGLMRVFLDGGVQAKYTFVDYPETTNFAEETAEELLWGPYAKIGMRYSF